MWTRYVYASDIEFVDYHHTLDTSLSYFEMYNPIIIKFENTSLQWANVNLGNLGSASFSLSGFAIHNSEYHTGLDAYASYMYTPDQIKFFNTQKPFTDLGYVQGLYNEQMLHVLHSQNISSNWNLGFDIRKLGSNGIYQSQKNNLSNVALSSWARSKNQKFNNLISLCYNHFKLQDNGGVQNDNVFTDSLIISKSLAAVWLDSSKTEITDRCFNVQTSYMFGDSSFYSDWDSSKIFVEKCFVQHSFKYQSGSYFFYAGGNDLSGYQNLFIDSFHTNDSLEYKLIQNEFYFNPGVNYNSKLRFGLTLQHQLWQLSGWQQDTSFQLLPLTVSVKIKPIEFLPLLDVSYNTELLHHIFNLHTMHAQLQFIKLNFYCGYVSGTTMPSFIQNHFSGNNFRWENQFEFEQYKGWYFGNYFDSKFNFYISTYKVENLLYWNETAAPAQWSENINTFKCRVWKNTQLKNIHLNFCLQYQHQSNDSIIQLPAFVMFSQLYLERDYFKHALYAQAGVDMTYFTNYYAPAYAPEIGQFYNQGNLLLQKYYPAIDVFANLKIRSARIFLKVENATQTLTKSKGYFTALHYAANDTSFKFGIDWMMWN